MTPPEENQAARKARNLCHRIMAAAEATAGMLERGEYAAAYENLIAIEGYTMTAKVNTQAAMLERRWV